MTGPAEDGDSIEIPESIRPRMATESGFQKVLNVSPPNEHENGYRKPYE